MIPSVRTGVAAYVGYGSLLAVEALWIAEGSRWFDSARELAAIHAFSAVGPATGAAIFFVISWAMTRGYRWAWYTGVMVGGLFLLGAVGLLLELMMVFPHLEAWPPATTKGPLVAAGILSLACLGTGVFSLCRKEARTPFLTGSKVPTRDASGAAS
jgi:hypothetical protein